MINYALKARTQNAKDAFLLSQERIEWNKRWAKKVETYRNTLIDEEIKRINRQRIIKTMEIDSDNWLNPDNLEEKIDRLVVVPDVVENSNDYYRKL